MPDDKKPKTEQEKMQDFYKEYIDLCKKWGFNIVVVPAYKMSQDTGTWSTVLQTSVGKIAKKR